MHAIQHLSALAPMALVAFVQADPAAADVGAGVLGQQLVTGLSNGMIIALIAIGYTMVYGIIELINFAHGDLCMLGAFFALTAAGVGRVWRTLGWAHALVTAFVVVGTGNHWLLDVVGGWAVVAVAWAGVEIVTQRRAPADATAAAPTS